MKSRQMLNPCRMKEIDDCLAGRSGAKYSEARGSFSQEECRENTVAILNGMFFGKRTSNCGF